MPIEKGPASAIDRRKRAHTPYKSILNSSKPELLGDIVQVPKVGGFYTKDYPAACMYCGVALTRHSMAPVFNDVPLTSKSETAETIRILCNDCYENYPASSRLYQAPAPATSAHAGVDAEAGHAGL